MAEILMTTDGLTEEEVQKILILVRNLSRKRQHIGAEELRYTMYTVGNRFKKHVSRQQAERDT